MPHLTTEKELEDFLAEQLINVYQLTDEFEKQNHELSNIFGVGKPFQQVHIKGYGTCDIIFLDFDYDPYVCYLNIHILEIKKGNIDFNAIGQICRYKTAIDRLIEKNSNIKKKFQISVSGFIVGEEVSDGDICYVLDHIDWLTAITYKIDLKKGIIFNNDNSDWYSNDEDFINIEARFLDYFFKEIKPKYKDFLTLKKEYKKQYETG